MESSQLRASGDAAGLDGKALDCISEGPGFESVQSPHIVCCFTFFPEQIIFLIWTMIL